MYKDLHGILAVDSLDELIQEEAHLLSLMKVTNQSNNPIVKSLHPVKTATARSYRFEDANVPL